MGPISLIFTLAVQNPGATLGAVERILDRKGGACYTGCTQMGTTFICSAE